MKFLWQYLLVVVALMAASPLLGACGGGEEELDLDEYFRRLKDISDAAQTDVGALQEEGEGFGVEIESTRGYLDGLVAIFEETLKDVNGLHPPAEARGAHDEFVVALEEALPLWEDFGDRVADVESPSELQALLRETEDEPGFDAARARVDNACLELQGIADENDIDVDLECEE